MKRAELILRKIINRLSSHQFTKLQKVQAKRASGRAGAVSDTQLWRQTDRGVFKLGCVT